MLAIIFTAKLLARKRRRRSAAAAPRATIGMPGTPIFLRPLPELLGIAARRSPGVEDCNRAWRGWFYYFDPRPWDGKCKEYPAPYVVKLGEFQLAVVDSSANKDIMLDEAQVTAYAAQLASLHVKNAWLTTHHPFWGFYTDRSTGWSIPTSVTLEEAWEKGRA